MVTLGMMMFIICLHVSVEHIPSGPPAGLAGQLDQCNTPSHSPTPLLNPYPAVLTPSPLFKDQTSISAQAVSDDLITLASPLRIQLLLTVHQQITIYSPNCETAVGRFAQLRCVLSKTIKHDGIHPSRMFLLVILDWVAHFKKMQQTVWSLDSF